jgi:transglutaminase superfamily protein
MSAGTVIDPRAGAAVRPLQLDLRALVDIGFALVLSGLAIYGFRSTFSGHHYLVVGLAGAVLGVALATLVTWRRWPVWTLALLVPAAFFLVGGALVLSAEAPGGVLPDRTVLHDLATVLADGWKRLLTTLPPVAGDGRLLAIPFLLGLLAGAIGAAVAQRSRARFAPSIGPALALVGVLLLGTAQPAARLWQGIGFGCLVVCWAGARRPGSKPLTLRPTPGGPQRLVIGALVLAIAGAGAAWVGPQLPGHDRHRVVLRNYVRPPFDVAAYASPLVGFRKYTKDAKQLYDQQLFTVSGLPAGTPLRIATLDDYDGSVWGATNGTVPTGPGQPIDAFQRVGSRVDAPALGRVVSLRITIDRPYAAAPDANPWVPTAGTLSSVRFTGARAAGHEESFRYNLVTGTGAVADRLAAGDSYRLRAQVARTSMPRDAAPYGPPTVDQAQYAFVGSRATQWSAKAEGVMGQVDAVARYMRDNGAYSDGGPGEAQYLPGHSISRITSFLNLPQLVGDDEQYGATFALICNYLGLPARVVLVADDVNDGIVRGRNVHTAVEVHVRSGDTASWVMIGRQQFMPDQTKKPNKQPPQTLQDANAAIVPPPNPVHPPSTLDEPDRPDQNTQHLGKVKKPSAGPLSGWFGAVVLWAGIPLAVLLLLAALIAGIKWRRRTLRRSRGPVPHRFDAGWRELVDWARDLGATVPGGRTRSEQAAALADRPAGERAAPLASAADAGVFGPGDPAPQAAADYWRQVDEVRRAMARDAGRFGRLRAALNLRSLRRPTRAVLTT